MGPLQHDDIDTGDPLPVRCLKNGLWLSVENALPFAVLLTPEIQYGCGAGVHLDLGVPEGEAGLKFSQDFFAGLESRVNQARTYRGRVISLENDRSYTGRGGTVKVHRLRTVRRDEVILPQKTFSLLERNVMEFTRIRDKIKGLDCRPKKACSFTDRRGRARLTRSTSSLPSFPSTPPCS